MTVNPNTPLLPADGKALFGLYSSLPEGTGAKNNAERVARFTQRQQLIRPGFGSNAATRGVDVGQFFFRFDDDPTYVDSSYPLSLLDGLHSLGVIPMWTWMGTISPALGIAAADLIPAIGDPNHPGHEAITAVIRRQAQRIRTLGYPVMIRLFHEMNGEWSTWNASRYGNSWKFRVAWRRIVELFAEERCTNAVWVWCPNAGDHPEMDWNSKWQYWPGDDYVHWIGCDGYGWTPEQTWAQTWSAVLDDLSTPHPHPDPKRNHAATQPIIICETSSHPLSRSAYVSDMSADLVSRPSVRGVMWFDQDKKDGQWSMDAPDDWGAGLIELQRFANHPRMNPRYVGPT